MFPKVCVLFFALFMGTIFASTVFVSVNGTDTPGCGPTLEQPCATIAYAVNVTQDADIYLLPGRHFIRGMIPINNHLFLSSVTNEEIAIVDLSDTNKGLIYIKTQQKI